jgi:NADPH:quinone reductase
VNSAERSFRIPWFRPRKTSAVSLCDSVSGAFTVKAFGINHAETLRRGGRACLAGFLGGLDPVPDFNPLLQMSSGVHFSFFGSFVFGKPGFPLSDVPLQTVAEQVAAGRYKAKPARVFRFEDIREAHRVMEANQANGKMVVLV